MSLPLLARLKPPVPGSDIKEQDSHSIPQDNSLEDSSAGQDSLLSPNAVEQAMGSQPAGAIAPQNHPGQPARYRVPPSLDEVEPALDEFLNAIMHGQLDEVQQLWDAGIKDLRALMLSLEPESYSHPLLQAAHRRHPDVLEWLLDRGFNPQTRGSVMPYPGDGFRSEEQDGKRCTLGELLQLMHSRAVVESRHALKGVRRLMKVYDSHPCREPRYIPEYARHSQAGAGAASAASSGSGVGPSGGGTGVVRKNVGGTRHSVLDRVLKLGAFASSSSSSSSSKGSSSGGAARGQAPMEAEAEAGGLVCGGSGRRKPSRTQVSRWAPRNLPKFLRPERMEHWKARSRLDGKDYVPPAWEAERMRHAALEQRAADAAQAKIYKALQARDKAAAKAHRLEIRRQREAERQRRRAAGMQGRMRARPVFRDDFESSSSSSDSSGSGHSDSSSSYGYSPVARREGRYASLSSASSSSSSGSSDEGGMTLGDFIRGGQQASRAARDAAQRKERRLQAKRRRIEQRMPELGWAEDGRARQSLTLQDSQTGEQQQRDGDGVRLDLDTDDELDSDDDELGAGARAARHARLNSKGASTTSRPSGADGFFGVSAPSHAGPRILPTLDFKTGSQLSQLSQQDTLDRHLARDEGSMRPKGIRVSRAGASLSSGAAQARAKKVPRYKNGVLGAKRKRAVSGEDRMNRKRRGKQRRARRSRGRRSGRGRTEKSVQQQSRRLLNDIESLISGGKLSMLQNRENSAGFSASGEKHKHTGASASSRRSAPAGAAAGSSRARSRASGSSTNLISHPQKNNSPSQLGARRPPAGAGSSCAVPSAERAGSRTTMQTASQGSTHMGSDMTGPSSVDDNEFPSLLRIRDIHVGTASGVESAFPAQGRGQPTIVSVGSLDQRQVASQVPEKADNGSHGTIVAAATALAAPSVGLPSSQLSDAGGLRAFGTSASSAMSSGVAMHTFDRVPNYSAASPSSGLQDSTHRRLDGPQHTEPGRSQAFHTLDVPVRVAEQLAEIMRMYHVEAAPDSHAQADDDEQEPYAIHVPAALKSWAQCEAAMVGWAAGQPNQEQLQQPWKEWSILRTVMRSKVLLFPEIGKSALRWASQFVDPSGDTIADGGSSDRSVQDCCHGVLHAMAAIHTAEARIGLLLQCSQPQIGLFDSIDKALFPPGSVAQALLGPAQSNLRAAKQHADQFAAEIALAALDHPAERTDTAARAVEMYCATVSALATRCGAPAIDSPLLSVVDDSDGELSADSSQSIYRGMEPMCPSAALQTWCSLALKLLAAAHFSCEHLAALTGDASIILSSASKVRSAWVSVWRRSLAIAVANPSSVCAKFKADAPRSLILPQASAFINGSTSDGLVLHSPLLALMRSLWFDGIGPQGSVHRDMLSAATGVASSSRSACFVVELLMGIVSLGEDCGPSNEAETPNARLASGPSSHEVLTREVKYALPGGSLDRIGALLSGDPGSGLQSMPSVAGLQAAPTPTLVSCSGASVICPPDPAGQPSEQFGTMLARCIAEASEHKPVTMVGRRCRLPQSLMILATSIESFHKRSDDDGSPSTVLDPSSVVLLLRSVLRGMDGSVEARTMPLLPAVQAGRIFGPNSGGGSSQLSHEQPWITYVLQCGLVSWQQGIHRSILQAHSEEVDRLCGSAFKRGTALSDGGVDFDGSRDLRVCLGALLSKIQTNGGVRTELQPMLEQLSDRQSSRGASQAAVREGVQQLLLAATVMEQARLVGSGPDGASDSHLSFDAPRLNARVLGSLKSARHFADVCCGRVTSLKSSGCGRSLGQLVLRLLSVQSHLRSKLDKGQLSDADLFAELQYVGRVLKQVCAGKCRSRIASVLVLCQIVCHLQDLVKAASSSPPGAASGSAGVDLAESARGIAALALGELQFVSKIACTRQQLLEWASAHLSGAQPDQWLLVDISRRILGANSPLRFRPANAISLKTNGGTTGSSLRDSSQQGSASIPEDFALHALQQASKYARFEAVRLLRAKQQKVREQVHAEHAAGRIKPSLTLAAPGRPQRSASMKSGVGILGSQRASITRRIKQKSREYRLPSSLRSTVDSVSASTAARPMRALLGGGRRGPQDGKNRQKPKRRTMVGLLGGPSASKQRSEAVQRQLAVQQAKERRLARLVAADTNQATATPTKSSATSASRASGTSSSSLAAAQARAVLEAFKQEQPPVLHVDELFESALPGLGLGEEAAQLLKRLREIQEAPFWPAVRLQGTESAEAATALVLIDARQRVFAYSVLVQSIELLSMHTSLALVSAAEKLSERLSGRTAGSASTTDPNQQSGTSANLLNSLIQVISRQQSTKERSTTPSRSTETGSSLSQSRGRVAAMLHLESHLSVASLLSKLVEESLGHGTAHRAADATVAAGTMGVLRSQDAADVPATQSSAAGHSMPESLASEDLDALAAIAEETEASASTGAGAASGDGSRGKDTSPASAFQIQRASIRTSVQELLRCGARPHIYPKPRFPAVLAQTVSLGCVAGYALSHSLLFPDEDFGRVLFSTRGALPGFDIPTMPDMGSLADGVKVDTSSPACKGSGSEPHVPSHAGVAAWLQLRQWILITGPYLDGMQNCKQQATRSRVLQDCASRLNPFSIQSNVIVAAATALQSVQLAPGPARTQLAQSVQCLNDGITALWQARRGCGLSETNSKFHLFDFVWQAVAQSTSAEGPAGGSSAMMDDVEHAGDDEYAMGEIHDPVEECQSALAALVARLQGFLQHGCACACCTASGFHRRAVVIDGREQRLLKIAVSEPDRKAMARQVLSA